MYPEFFEKVPALSLFDPLAALLGAVPDGVITYRYVDAVKLAGHSCPTVAGAWLLARHALARLYPQGLAQRGNVRVALREAREIGTTGVVANIIGLLTGAADEGGFKGLAGQHARHGLLAYGQGMQGEVRFTRMDTQTSVELSYHAETVPATAAMQTLMGRLMAGDASSDERAEFGRLWQERVRRILLEHAEDPGLIREHRVEQ